MPEGHFKTMEFAVFGFTMVVFHSQILRTDQKDTYLLTTVLQTNWKIADDKCVERALLRSGG